MKLDRSFYLGSDACTAARNLLGKVLVSRTQEGITSGMIVETEAYMGVTDRASHAYGGRRTKRNDMMYAQGGTAYVYLCYGIHHLFNVVVNEAGVPHAVLVRAVHPIDGHSIMQRRRPNALTSSGGPGTLTQSLGIRILHNGTDLTGDTIWIEERGLGPTDREVITGPRIGVDYAGDDALLPYRYRFAPSHPIGT